MQVKKFRQNNLLFSKRRHITFQKAAFYIAKDGLLERNMPSFEKGEMVRCLVCENWKD